MIVVNDLCGDEDDGYLSVSFMVEFIKESIYRNLRETVTYDYPECVTIKLDKPIRYISFTHEVTNEDL